ncbi:MAG: hypothetical protein WDZ29_03465 [Balneolaceae bacterium]
MILLIDLITRLSLTVILESEFSLTRFAVYPGAWPWLLLLIGVIAAVAGTYTARRLSGGGFTAGISFMLLLGFWRTWPLLTTTAEPAFQVLLSTILSLTAAAAIWNQNRTAKLENKPNEPESNEKNISENVPLSGNYGEDVSAGRDRNRETW